MNTLIDIALTTQSLKAHHSPTVELLCLSWERSCMHMAPCHAHLEMCTCTHTHSPNTKKQQSNLATCFTQLIPDPLINTHTHSASHPTLHKIVTYTRPPWPPTPPCHTISALLLTPQHRPSLPLSFSAFSSFSPLAFLPVFMDQQREQLHQRRSGGREMKS